MEASYLMINLLKDVVKYGTGVRAYIDGREIAGKTGTVEQFAWFMGADGEKMMIISQNGKDLLGGRDVAPIWRKIALNTDIGKTPFVISSTYRKLNVIRNDPMKYIDYEYLYNMIKEGTLTIEELADILKTFDEDSLLEFLSYMNTVSQEITITLWNMLGGG